MTTRSDILLRAFARIGIAAYEYAIDPTEMADTRSALDAMMAEWEAQDVVLGYTPSEDDNDGVGMTTPLYADSAISANLALRLAPDYGVTPSPLLLKDAKTGWNLVRAKTVTVLRQERASTVRGAGDRYYWVL